MIATFLRAELDSPRFGDQTRRALATHAVEPEVIRVPDLADRAQNEARRQVLMTCRGWGDYESVFGGLPAEDVAWSWAEFDADDLRDRVFTISWYFEETFGTRSASAIAEMRRRADPTAAEPVLDAVRAGRLPPPPVLVSDPKLQRFVILEGHKRILAYVSDVASVPFPLQALVGISARIAEWSEW